MLRKREAEEIPLFCALYESEYDGGHPAFLEMTFAEAVAEARQQERLLLAWLRSPANVAADHAFGSKIWPSEIVRALTEENFVVWAGDVERWFGPAHLQQVLQLPGVPALIVLQPMSVYEVDGFSFVFGHVLEGTPCEYPAGTAWKVLDWLDASKPEVLDDGEVAVAEFLCGAGTRWEEQRRQAENERMTRQQEADEWRALRDMQDVEFVESLRKDQEMERKRQAVAAAAPSPASPSAGVSISAPTVPSLSAVRVPSAEELPSALVLRRRAAAERLAAQTALPVDDRFSCQLVIRLPSGRRLERTFNASNSVAAVYEWADCSVELQALAAAPGGDTARRASASIASEVPEHFLLCVTFPRQPLMDRGINLRSAGLCPNAVLALAPTEAPELLPE